MDFVRARNRRQQEGWSLCARGTVHLLAAALLYSLFGAGRATAKEQAEEFVKGLQERGLHSIALDYLEQLKTSPLADEDTRKQVPYLRGVALIEQSRQSPDPAARNRFLDEARKDLEQYAEASPQSASAAEAQLQLGSVQMSRGQEIAVQAAKLQADKSYDSQRKTLGRDARKQFAEARETFRRAEEIFSTELEKLPPASGQASREDTETNKRLEYRGRVAQLRFLAAQSQFESAQTYPKEADEFRKLNEAAAQELAAIYDEFSRSMPVGLYARLWEGRCYQAVGNYQLALGCYEELLGNDPALLQLRKLMASALQRKAEVLTLLQKHDEAIMACRAALAEVDKEEEKQTEWLAVRYRLAEALSKKAESLGGESPEQKKLLAEARDAYRTVAKTPNEFQLVARTSAASGAKNLTGDDSKKAEPRTFQAAYDLGKEALSNYNAAKQAIPSAEKNNPTAVPELTAEMETGKEDARRYFRIAATLIEPDTDAKLVNEVRYFLCWLYWEAGDFHRAAVLGEFLARRFPDHPAASSAAKISMASYERLYNQAVAAGKKQDDGSYELGRMAQMAEFIVRRWPGTADADAAFGVLVSVAIRSDKTDDAEKMLKQASEQSRPRLELMLGNALWARWLERSQASQTAAADAESLAQLKSSAIKYLKNGLDAASKDSSLREAAATASLYLSQAALSDGNYADAIAILEQNSGPLALIKAEEPAAMKPQYAIEAYKAALRAYISVTPPQEKKAIEAMKSLETVVNESLGENARDQLTRIYIGVGVGLKKQLDDSRAAGNQREANEVAAAFAKLLERIGGQQENASWPARAWLAQMYYAMGSPDPSAAIATSSSSASQAKEYLTKARDAYEKLLDEVAKDAKLAPSSAAVLAAKAQLGDCYRELGQYDKALDMFADILTAREASLAVQKSAAMAYQARGQTENPKYFESAIHGGYRSKESGQNRIWGWLKISQITARAAQTDEKFRDSFYEARLNISKCRYQAAMKQTGEARSQDLARAKQSVQSFAQLYPDLGGDRWKPQFERLMKDIDEAMNESE